MTIEDELKELEEITSKLESNIFSLEDSLKLYSRGVQLSESISQKIENAKMQVNYIKSEE